MQQEAMHSNISTETAHPRGWRYVPPALGRDDEEFISSEGRFPSKGGRLHGPTVRCDTDPFAFYRVRFASRFSESGYYAVTFQDAAGRDLVDDLYGVVDASSAWQKHQVCFRGRELGRTLGVQFVSYGQIAVQHLSVERVGPAVVRRWADRLYATLPPLLPCTPMVTAQRMERTMQRLRDGGERPLRVVMLGDSIINDINNSNWDALVGRHYPRCRIQVIASVRGATGCWYYREDEHFDHYVRRRRPDLLIVGGISHRHDLDAIGEVIDKALDTIGCEVLLLSGPMGTDWRASDPNRPAATLPRATYTGDSFSGQLATLAKQAGIDFLDMNRWWNEYLGASGMPFHWFHRDPVHANDRGRQVLGRMLEWYFAPASMRSVESL